MSIFVDRQDVFDNFNAFLRRNNPNWLFLIGGVEGIGKTAVLRQLVSRCQTDNNKRCILLNFASPQLSDDPLLLLNRLARELPETSYQQYTEDLLRAYNNIRKAHIKTENEIRVNRGNIFTGDILQDAPERFEIQENETEQTLNRLFVECNIQLHVEGTVHANQIVQIASVDLGDALQQLKQHIRDELATRFIQVVAEYLQAAPHEQIIIFLDNLDQIQHQIEGESYVEWLMESLIGTLHQRFTHRIRAVATSVSITTWPEQLQHQAHQHTLLGLTLEDTTLYFQQRDIRQNKVVQRIHELTQGHPLCIVLATILYNLAPHLGVKELQQYATEPFDSSLLAYRLYQAIVENIPDEAMKKLLRYAPIFPILDDQVIEGVLAVELGLAKDLIKDYLEKLREYAILEDVETIIFRPVIRIQALADLRSANDPIYRRFNRQAYILFGSQWRDSPVIEKREFRLKMMYYEINLAPEKAPQVMRKNMKEAVQQKDYELATDIIKLAQSGDIPRLTKKDIYDLAQRVPRKYRPNLPRHETRTRILVNNLSDTPSALATVTIVGWSSIVRVWRKVKHFITSPLWKLRIHHWRAKRLHQNQTGLYIDIVNRQIPALGSIQNDAVQLRMQVLGVAIDNVLIANRALAQMVQQAQNLGWRVSVNLFDAIAAQFDRQNNAAGQTNDQLHAFQQHHNNLISRIKQAEDRTKQNHNTFQEILQESKQLWQEAQQLFAPDTAMQFANDQEEEKAHRIVAEIEEYYRKISQAQVEVDDAVNRFEQARPPVIRAINELNGAISNLQREISVANAILKPFEGIQIECVDGRRSMHIYTRQQ